ncbi:hydrogenase maturation nickel metallochaperone HypA [Streptomyces sp. 142MFCol3.1]|uniref:hydrogenase maturation nickel metallochaperone HypA/HybF n=1 Tax=Streptomyces sp. 142MFCol3.1 TaxID=1172179 RepID=UPI00099733A2|nr:hydrogenase maturation nickel metallochaperone HypA [Streptomyces sp. 142MFCol3.1]
MHELSIAVAVVEQVEEAVRGQGSAVESLTLRIGELAGVVPEALDFSFGLATEGTALAGARLLIETVEAWARCDGCGREASTGMPPVLWCADCGNTLTLLGGRELEIVRVVVADGSPDGGTPHPGPRAAPAAGRTDDQETSHVPHR